MESLLFAFLGLLIGAIINRAADNLPARRNLLDAPHCPYCDTPRPVLDQTAVLSYLLFRGKCPNCNAPIPFRSPIVEISSALTFAFLWARDGATFLLLLDLIYTTIFLLVFIIDFEHRLILNIVILPSILLAALASPWSRFGMVPSLIGGAVAFAIVLVFYLFGALYSRMRHLSIPGGAFGQGDVMLAAYMGIVTGFPNVLNAIVYAILFGGAGAILFLVYQLIVHRRLALTAAIPYGPFFCMAGWVMMVFGT